VKKFAAHKEKSDENGETESKGGHEKLEIIPKESLGVGE